MAKAAGTRNFNWAPEEISILADMYDQYAEILDSKLTNSVTNMKKQAVLNKIKLNLKLNYPKYRRDVRHIKQKLKTLKTEARALSNRERNETAQTGGGRSSIKPNKMHEKIINFNKKTPSFIGGISGGIESDDIFLSSARAAISPTSSPLFSETPSTSRKSPRFSQDISSKRKKIMPLPLPATTSRKISVAEERQVSKAKPSTSSMNSADYINQLRVEVLELEKERLQLEIEKIRRKNELLEIKKLYFERKLEKL